MAKEDEIKKLLNIHFDNYSLSAISGGTTTAKLFRIVTKDRGNFVLKIAENVDGFETLRNDKINYEWLSNKVPVPSMLFYQETDKHEFLCMSELEGQTLAANIGRYSNDEVIKIFACSLKQLHSLKLDAKALIRSIDKVIEQVAYKTASGLIELDSFEEENIGKSPEQLFEKLKKYKLDKPELVFTHGDYCFDNIIVNKGILSGFIDIGRGGVADKYQDIALALRSIKHELGEEWAGKFLDEYGLRNIDNKKIEFFTLLDEFY